MSINKLLCPQKIQLRKFIKRKYEKIINVDNKMNSSFFNNLPKLHQVIFIIGLFGIIVGTIGTHISTDLSFIIFFDNLHWTSGTLFAAILAYLGMKKNKEGDANKSSLWFFIGFAGYAIGQIIWDIQTIVSYNKFPSPSDLFYLLLGPSISFALFYELYSNHKKFNKVAYWLDLLALSVATLTLVLMSYLPRQGELDILSMAVLVAYPITLIIPILMIFLLVLVLRLKLDTNLVLFFITLSITAYSWMNWNSVALDGKTLNGSWHNVLFSISILLFGLVVSNWRLISYENPKYERYSESFLNLLPIVTVIFSSIALIMVASNKEINPIVADLVYFGGFIVTILAMVRQSRLLHERDLLIEIQQKAIRSANLVQTIIQNVPVRILWKDKDLNYLGLNNLCAKDAGFEKPEDVIGKSDFEMGWKDQAELYRADDFHVMKTGQAVIGYEEVQTTPSGEQIWLRTSKIPLIDLITGETIGIFGMYDDITDQKVLIQELQKTQSKFQTLFEESLDGIVLMDPQTQKFIEFNHHACEMYGYTKEEFGLLTPKDLDALHDAEQIMSTQQAIIKNGWDKFTTKHKAKDGSIKDIIVSVKVFMIDSKPVLHATFHDITEMKKQGELIKQQKEEFETIFNYSKDGIAILDLNSNFLNFNDSYLEMTGYSREVLLQKSCIDLTAPEDKEKSKEAFQFVLEHQHLQNYEKSCIVNDGKVIITNMSISLLPDKKRILLVMKDVSKLKLFESQAKLASMGEMIGNIAHQWRQPLNVISTTASGIAIKKEFGTLKDEELITYMEQIVEQTNYLSKTIDDFRNFIKGEKAMKDLNFGLLCEKTLSIVGPSLKSNYIELVTNIDETIEIKGYENELMQAFINIINNSKDALLSNSHIENKYIFIDVKRKNNQCEIVIKDNGGGIKLSAMHRIFEPYFTTKHQSQGTGLGLSMTYKIVTELHEGTIIASNTTFEYNGEEYTGGCFTIVFPL